VAAHLPLGVQFPRRSWHVIEKTSLFDSFTASLDVRGKREHDLYEELVGPQGAQQSLRRYLYDDVKEEAKAHAQLKEKEALKHKLEAARIRCNEEQGRRSGRLASHAESDLIALEEELQALEQRMEGKVEVDARDHNELTGLTVLQKYDSKSRIETRRTREKKLASVAASSTIPTWQCSKLLSTGHIDGTGIIGMLVAEMMELEERCENLAPWEQDGKNRETWIMQLENAIVSWNSISPFVMGTPFAGSVVSVSSPNETKNSKKRDSLNELLNGDSEALSNSKRRRLESPQATSSHPTGNTVASIISMLKPPLIELEERVANMTNITVAARDADIADDNMSTDGSDDDQANKERQERVWKKHVSQIRSIATKRHAQIREKLVAAISAARQAHLPDVVARLRTALLLYHPGAAGDCKVAAIKVLESYGGFLEDDEEAESDEEDAAEEKKGDDKEDESFPSVLSADAAILISSLEGSDDASRKEWVDAVKSSRTIARLASLTAGFAYEAKKKLKKTEEEKTALADALASWGMDEDRRNKKGKTKSTKNDGDASEVWANVRITDEICMAKAEDYPWWPAKKCQAKDPSLAKTLSELNRSLVAFIGEMGGLRVVKDDNIRPFTGATIEEGKEKGQEGMGMSKDLRNQLEECMAMARRITRGRKKTTDKRAR